MSVGNETKKGEGSSETSDFTIPAKPEPGTALCLSGGGYRAMLFHLGAIQRLNSFGLLKQLNRISSVSGGSIVAGLLGIRWNSLTFDGSNSATNLDELVVAPLRRLAERTLDIRSIVKGILSCGTINDQIVRSYDKYLFDGATLQDFPAPGEGPRFVLNATNLQTGALWRFSRPYMADYKVGVVRNPTVRISVAVASSSAFPPFLSPAFLKIRPSDFDIDPHLSLQVSPYTTDVILTDGGVYDNLGLETAWKRCQTLLVSDGGGKMEPQPTPPKMWGRQTLRVLDVIDNQVRSLRKRQLIASFQDPGSGHNGAYWGIGSHVADYVLPNALPCPLLRTVELANTATRLKALDRQYQERLMNWGFAICDAAIRKHVDPKLPPPTAFPYSTAV